MFTSRLIAYSNVRCVLRPRHFWSWLNFVSNKVDHSRVEEVGPEIAAAEWVLRNGGKVKLSIFNNWTTDYHRLPSEAGAVLEAIDAQGGSLIDVGLDHLAGLHNLHTLNLQGCKYISDSGLQRLLHVAETLQHLNLNSCVGITHKGLPQLYNLKKLRVLDLRLTPSIKNRASSLAQLRLNIPHCDIQA